MLTVRTSENTVITSFRLISERQDFSSVRTGENTVRARARIQKIRISPNRQTIKEVKNLLASNILSTVCEQACCPNLGECFNNKRATFLIMGNVCTRRCPFCDIAHGYPDPLDPEEPKRLAEAVKALKLKYVVITSVDRDDLKDGGASHFAECVQELKKTRRRKS